MVTKLFTTAVKPINDYYEDFYSREEDDEEGVVSEKGAVLTIETVSHVMDRAFDSSYDHDDEKIDFEKFEENMAEIGVTKDKEEDDFRSYTVVIPDKSLYVDTMERWVERLNEKHDEDFELWTECLTCGKSIPINTRYEPDQPVPEMEEWKRGKPTCSERCYRNYTGHSRVMSVEKKAELEDSDNLMSLDELKEKMSSKDIETQEDEE